MSKSFFITIGTFKFDPLLTGTNYKEANISLFYPIVFGTASILSCFSALTISISKVIGHKKDKNLVKNITIMITNKGETEIKINNARVGFE